MTTAVLFVGVVALGGCVAVAVALLLLGLSIVSSVLLPEDR